MRSGRSFEVFSISFVFSNVHGTYICASRSSLPYYNYIFAILSGGGKKGVAIRPYPAPGPPPFIPNAFLMCETLAGFDSYWATSRKEEYKLGEIFLLVEKYLRPTNNLS